VVKAKPQTLYPRERDRVLTALEAGWASGLIWTGTDIFASTVSKSRNVQPIVKRCIG